MLSNFIYDKKITVSDEEIDKIFDEIRKERRDIPEYVYDCHTLKGKKMGKTKDDFFREEEKALANKQLSIFDFLVK